MVVEKKVIVQWYTPDEKLPELDTRVVATIDGRYKNIKFTNALAILEWSDDCGWFSYDYDFEELDVIAWCDIEPVRAKR